MLNGLWYRLRGMDDGGSGATVDDVVNDLPEQVNTQLPADVDLLRVQGDRASETATRAYLDEKAGEAP